MIGKSAHLSSSVQVHAHLCCTRAHTLQILIHLLICLCASRQMILLLYSQAVSLK